MSDGDDHATPRSHAAGAAARARRATPPAPSASQQAACSPRASTTPIARSIRLVVMSMVRISRRSAAVQLERPRTVSVPATELRTRPGALRVHQQVVDPGEIEQPRCRPRRSGRASHRSCRAPHAACVSSAGRDARGQRLAAVKPMLIFWGLSLCSSSAPRTGLDDLGQHAAGARRDAGRPPASRGSLCAAARRSAARLRRQS